MLDLSVYKDEDMGELGVADEGEYDIRLVKFMADKQGEVLRYYGEDDENPYFNLLFEIIDHPDADNFKDFSYFVNLPAPGDTPKERKIKLNRINTLGAALGIEFFGGEPIDPLDYNGNVTCSAVLGKSESEQYGEQNEIKQILIER